VRAAHIASNDLPPVVRHGSEECRLHDAIDTHCHVSPIWYEPVETLLFQMQRHGVSHAVLTQMLGQTDNAYLLECAARFPGRFSCVGGIDESSDAAAQELRALARAGIRGVRLQAAPAPAGLSFERLWRAAADENLVVSCAGPVSAFMSRAFERRLLEFPSLIVLGEHLGGLARADTPADPDTLEGIRALARYANFHLKVPSLGQFCPRPRTFSGRQRPLDPGAGRLIHEIVEAFGSERLCWGSDFPLVSGREGYGNALEWSRELLQSLGTQAARNVLSNTARRIFRIVAESASA